MKLMWACRDLIVRNVVVRPYGNPVNKVWQDEWGHFYDEGDNIFHTEAEAIRIAREHARNLVNEYSTRAFNFTQRLVELGEE